MWPDDINPGTGLAVALVSVFLVFGFMFTVSGMKGETLGKHPPPGHRAPPSACQALRPLPWLGKTEGCNSSGPRMSCCGSESCLASETQGQEVVELLRTPSDLESGKGVQMSWLRRRASGGKPFPPREG